MATEAPTRTVVEPPIVMAPTKATGMGPLGGTLGQPPAGAPGTGNTGSNAASKAKFGIFKVLDILGVLLGAAGLLFVFIWLAWLSHNVNDDLESSQTTAKKTWDDWIFILLAGAYLIPTFLIKKVPFFPILHTFFLAVSWVYLFLTADNMIDNCNHTTGIEDYCRFNRLGFVGWLCTWLAFMHLAITSSLKYRHHYSTSNSHSPSANTGPGLYSASAPYQSNAAYNV
eukprot:jgi/Chlat1/2990/Chrsp2S08921